MGKLTVVASFFLSFLTAQAQLLSAEQRKPFEALRQKFQDKSGHVLSLKDSRLEGSWTVKYQAVGNNAEQMEYFSVANTKIVTQYMFLQTGFFSVYQKIIVPFNLVDKEKLSFETPYYKLQTLDGSVIVPFGEVDVTQNDLKVTDFAYCRLFETEEEDVLVCKNSHKIFLSFLYRPPHT